jgi:phosphoribosylformimino-5-aminoimidazole carboxamide ribotide isomerase
LFESFTVIPSIDLKAGQVVRLVRGDMASATVYGDDPALTARAFEEAGAQLIHIVDLDGACRGEPCNLKAIGAIRAAVRCALEMSGGLRSMGAIEKAFAHGADRVSVGSAAFLSPELLRQACCVYPGRVFGSVDARDGRAAIKGWHETSPLTVAEALERFADAGAAAIILTDISRDGTELGADLAMFASATASSRLPVIASGGIASLDDIRALSALFDRGVAGAISGRALYEGRFSLAEAIAATR